MAILTPGVNVGVDTGPSSFSTVSLLQPTAFKLTIDRKFYANLEFFCQSVSHPSMALNTADAAYQRLVSIPLPGDKLSFGDLDATIILDEEMNSYVEMYNWFNRILNENVKPPLQRNIEAPSHYADITLNILSSHNNTTKQIRYFDAIPTGMSNINFGAQEDGSTNITFTTTFRFTYFEIV